MDAQFSIRDLAFASGQALLKRGRRVCVAESCTGGALAEALTSPPGSSAWFDRGFVVYSNSAKEQLLHVNPETLRTFGAVSEAVVREMAMGALACSESEVAIALSGVAGPGGGSDLKPIGTVCMAVGTLEGDGAEIAHAQTSKYSGDRDSVRAAAVAGALRALLEWTQERE